MNHLTTRRKECTIVLEKEEPSDFSIYKTGIQRLSMYIARKAEKGFVLLCCLLNQGPEDLTKVTRKKTSRKDKKQATKLKKTQTMRKTLQCFVRVR
jgi:hypothetical protein